MFFIGFFTVDVNFQGVLDFEQYMKDVLILFRCFDFNIRLGSKLIHQNHHRAFHIRKNLKITLVSNEQEFTFIL